MTFIESSTPWIVMRAESVEDLMTQLEQLHNVTEADDTHT